MNDAPRGVSLAALKAVDQTEIEILWPGGTDGTGWFVTLAGPRHPKSIAISEAAGKKSLRRQAQIEAATVNGRKYKPAEVDVEEQRRENVENVVGRIVDWRGLTDDAGADVKFTEESGVTMFMDQALGWAFWQIVEALGDERSFTRRSATT